MAWMHLKQPLDCRRGQSGHYGELSFGVNSSLADREAASRHNMLLRLDLPPLDLPRVRQYLAASLETGGEASVLQAFQFGFSR